MEEDEDNIIAILNNKMHKENYYSNININSKVKSSNTDCKVTNSSSNIIKKEELYLNKESHSNKAEENSEEIVYEDDFEEVDKQSYYNLSIYNKKFNDFEDLNRANFKLQSNQNNEILHYKDKISNQENKLRLLLTSKFLGVLSSYIRKRIICNFSKFKKDHRIYKLYSDPVKTKLSNKHFPSTLNKSTLKEKIKSKNENKDFANTSNRYGNNFNTNNKAVIEEAVKSRGLNGNLSNHQKFSLKNNNSNKVTYKNKNKSIEKPKLSILNNEKRINNQLNNTEIKNNCNLKTNDNPWNKPILQCKINNNIQQREKSNTNKKNSDKESNNSVNNILNSNQVDTKIIEQHTPISLIKMKKDEYYIKKEKELENIFAVYLVNSINKSISHAITNFTKSTHQRLIINKYKEELSIRHSENIIKKRLLKSIKLFVESSKSRNLIIQKKIERRIFTKLKIKALNTIKQYFYLINIFLIKKSNEKYMLTLFFTYSKLLMKGLKLIITEKQDRVEKEEIKSKLYKLASSMLNN